MKILIAILFTHREHSCFSYNFSYVCVLSGFLVPSHMSVECLLLTCVTVQYYAIVWANGNVEVSTHSKTSIGCHIFLCFKHSRCDYYRVWFRGFSDNIRFEDNVCCDWLLVKPLDTTVLNIHEHYIGIGMFCVVSDRYSLEHRGWEWNERIHTFRKKLPSKT